MRAIELFAVRLAAEALISGLHGLTAFALRVLRMRLSGAAATILVVTVITGGGIRYIHEQQKEERRVCHTFSLCMPGKPDCRERRELIWQLSAEPSQRRRARPGAVCSKTTRAEQN